MLAKIYKKIKAMIINSKDDLRFYLKMNFTYLPLFILCLIVNLMCYGIFPNIASLNFNIQTIGSLSLFLVVVLSMKMSVLETHHKISRLEKKQSEQEIAQT
ncbi:MAG: hypothetical protein LBU56_01545 [Rickettsiales bacterium]|jgi:intracellular septation protein A|nr:hypothetical protein [Rickettsiales bacterium]